MNFGKGGQNIVQAGSNNPNMLRSAGSILNRFLGTKLNRQERDYHREKDFAARKDFEDYKAKLSTKGKLIEDMVRPAAAASGARQAYDIANEVHPEGHEKAGQFVNPEMANQVNRYGFDVGYRPAKTPASVQQVESWTRYRNENTKVESKTSKDDYSGTVARFGKDGSITREKLTEDDVDYKRKKSETPPDNMRNFDDSSRPSNQSWTDQQKADLERERPRTSNLNTGMNEGKDPSHKKDVFDAWSSGKITGEEASGLSESGAGKDAYDFVSKNIDTDKDIYDIHKSAGLDNNKEGTKY